MNRLLALCLSASLLAAPAMAAAPRFHLSSPDIKPRATLAEKFVFNGFGCTGGNVSPALHWTGAPAGTKSFVVTVYDPDAPTGSGWWHWVLYNIPASVTSLPEGAGTPGKEPPGSAQAVTDFGAPGFGGACPPKGDKPHRYVFTVYALKVEKLDVPANASPALIGFATHANMLGKASFTARYGR
jgi:Raf kinase inhibitor-like YbhB/YbcL family protein